jgi:NADH dehydrogenase [ubiquinone] 1 alpha subcomplex assembly factor 1
MLHLLQNILLVLLVNGFPQSHEALLFDFAQDQSRGRWYVVTDGVAGGRSRGTFGQGRGNYASFSGVLVGDKPGAFVSVWSRDAGLDLSRMAGLAFRVRGDGKTYRVALRMNRGVDAIQYVARITPPRSGWSLVRVSFRELVPMSQEEILKSAPPFDPSRVVAIGVVIADRQDGAFEFLIEKVSVYVE